MVSFQTASIDVPPPHLFLLVILRWVIDEHGPDVGWRLLASLMLASLIVSSFSGLSIIVGLVVDVLDTKCPNIIGVESTRAKSGSRR